VTRVRKLLDHVTKKKTNS